MRRHADAPLRVFFALWPDAPASAALGVLAPEVATRMAGRAPQSGNLHLTMAFVGEVGPNRVAVLQTIGRAAAARTAPFALTLDRVGIFRGSGIAWAGASSAPPDIMALAQRLAEGLAAERFSVEERAFHPHVTLARRCRRGGHLAIAPSIAWNVTRLVLNVSLLSSGSPRYDELDGWSLGG